MDNTAINSNEIVEVETKALALPAQAKLITVVDNGSMERANSFKLDIKAMMEEIDDTFKPLADKAFQSHRAITGKWNEVKKPLQEADTHVTTQVKNYLIKIRRQQEAEEARLRELARKEEENRILQEAQELTDEGRQEEADQIMSEPISYVAPTVKMDVPKVDKRMYATQTKVKVTDRTEFLVNCPVNTLLECLNEGVWTTIESGLSRKAKALGRAFNIVGCQVTEV